MDRLQPKRLSSIMRGPMLPNEAVADYARRRGRAAGVICRESGLSRIFGACGIPTESWPGTSTCGTLPTQTHGQPCSSTLDQRAAQWLQERRAVHRSESVLAGITLAQQQAEYPHGGMMALVLLRPLWGHSLSLAS